MTVLTFRRGIPAGDPILALIEAHRAAWAEYEADADAGDTEAMDRSDEILRKIMITPPTTISGVSIALAYVADFIATRHGSWPDVDADFDPVVDTDRWAVVFHRTLAQALQGSL